MNLIETDLGFEIRTEKILAFFGKKTALLSDLKTNYADLNFLRLKQVHGCDLVERSQGLPEEFPTADAHWTTSRHVALCINTADCIPVLIYNSKRNSVAAVHAGWRGVAQKITSHTIRNEFLSGAKPRDLLILIGPHIQKNSFEIEKPVLEQLLGSTNKDKLDVFTQIGAGKYLFDLNYLLKIHLEELDIPSENISTLYLDTKSDFRFHSYRRDKEKSGRQMSFICLL